MVDDQERSTMPLPPNRPGARLGPYRLLEQIGVGGMGEVWVAEQERPIRRRVAIKLIKLGMDTVEVLARFESERQALALMDHPNIAQIFDAGQSEGRPYFVMEYVDGTPLLRHCDDHRLTIRERLELFLQVCDGVQHAHQKAIIHRDLKPSNVLATVRDGHVVPKIIDFGVAKAVAQRLTEHTVYTELGQVIGTPSYMSPEQADLTGQNVDTRTDVYSLGVMLYEMLIGVRPFDARGTERVTPDELRRQILEEDPTPPSTRLRSLGDESGECARSRRTDARALRRLLTGDLDWIVLKCLEKDRTRRYGSPNELAADIRRLLENQPVTARPPSTAYRAGKFVRRHRVGVAVSGLFVLLLAGFATSMALQAQRIARERDRANLEADTAREVTDFLMSLFEVADPEEARGNSITVREVLDAGADRIGWELEDQPALRARLMNVMGRVYLSLGLYDPAEPLLQSALRMQRQAAGPQDLEAASVLHDLGVLHMLRGRTAVADSLYRLALGIRETRLGADHLLVAETLYRWGELHRILGAHEEAERIYRRVLDIQSAELQPQDPKLAETLNNLSVLYWHMNRLEDAEQAMRRSLAIREASLPPNHPRIAENLNNLGALDYARENYATAESYYRRALEIRERVYGPVHTEVAQTLYNLSALYVKQEKYAEARAVLARTLDIYREVFGEEHHLVAQCLHGLGVAWKEEGDLLAAEDHLLRSIALRERTMGPDHLRVAVSLYELADLYVRQGNLDQAERCLSRCFGILDGSVGDDHRYWVAATRIRDELAAARSKAREGQRD